MPGVADSQTIYHLLPKAVFDGLNGKVEYGAASLETEGFIHASFADQVLLSANRFYEDETNLVALLIDRTRVIAPVRDEQARDGGTFPHIYGPLNLNAVVEVRALIRAAGHWAGMGESLPLPTGL